MQNFLNSPVLEKASNLYLWIIRDDMLFNISNGIYHTQFITHQVHHFTLSLHPFYSFCPYPSPSLPSLTSYYAGTTLFSGR